MLCWDTWGRLKWEGCEQVAARVCRVRTACPGVKLAQRDGEEYVAGAQLALGELVASFLGEVHLFDLTFLSLAAKKVLIKI